MAVRRSFFMGGEECKKFCFALYFLLFMCYNYGGLFCKGIAEAMEVLKKQLTESFEETEAVGRYLASLMLEDGSLPPFVALYGDLGVGKTAFVRGFCAEAAPTSAVRSPTFALVNEYRGRSRPVFHFDMYRIGDEDELYAMGFYDYPERGICLVEWSENIEYALPEDYFRVTIEKTVTEHPDERIITVERVKEL